MANTSAKGQGTLFMLVGPGGVGKNAMMKDAIERIEDLLQLPTATTRDKREGEEHGIHHLFVTVEEFKKMIENDELLEYQEVHLGKFYGVPRSLIEKMIASNYKRIADVEFKGAAILRPTYPDNIVTVFITPPSYESLRERLQGRGATEEQTQERLERVAREMPYAPSCDFIIVNDEMDVAVDELCDIIHRQFGQNDESLGKFPVNDVSYKIMLSFVFEDEVSKYNSSAIISHGDDPDAVALRMAEARITTHATMENLHYATLDGTLPVKFEYDTQKHTYALTYHYHYRLEERAEL